MVTWTREEDKLFETALVKFDDEYDPERWLKIAGEVPGKTPEDIRVHYEALVYDIMMIESGRVEVPDYQDNYAVSGGSGSRSGGGKKKRAEFERKRGRPWTEEEHKLFLLGLEKYGKGDWRSISRNVVITRTPTQVASHAQKYFLRQSANKTDKKQKRNSIHDITISPQQHNDPVPFIDPSQVGSQGSYINPTQTGLQVPFILNPDLNPNPNLNQNLNPNLNPSPNLIPDQNLNPNPSTDSSSIDQNWLQDYVVDPNPTIFYGNPDFGFPM